MEAFFAKRKFRRLARLPFCRLILGDRLFGVALALFGSLPLILALFVMRIWVTSPSGFEPQIKVSGLDLAQAWSLKKSAARAAAVGEFEKASFAWLTACANNLGDVSSIRGFLRSFISAGGPSRFAKPAIQSSFWLLNLTATNRSDLDLAGEVLEVCKLPDLLVQRVAPLKDALSVELEARYLKSLFQIGEIVEFEQVWTRSWKRHSEDSALQLYRAAHLAGWGDFDQRLESLAKLDRAAASENLWLPANRLQLVVSARRFDCGRYANALARLASVGEDSLADHIGYWRLLLEAGREAEAEMLIGESSRQPSNAGETVAMSKLLCDLGLVYESFDVLGNAPANARASQEYWTFYADALFAASRWEDLRRISLQMRRGSLNGNRFHALGHYLEGRAELALERELSASAAFQRMLEWRFEDPDLTLRISQQLIRIGHPELAVQVLQSSNNTPPRNADYWALLFEAASREGDTDLMLEAASQWHKLSPNNPAAQQNYAAALLINRERADQAVRLTWLLKDRYPNSRASALNHAAALRLSGRSEEAESLLSEVDLNLLTESQSAVYHLNWLALDFEFGRYEEARNHLASINRNLLYSPQHEWLAEILQRLPEDGE
ncbi:MAG: hypothetical protein O2960_15170 [Verrucomicrobia bacterium]|nr:hypothetical protein [Verrucomicrobiota bacterium]